jgi:UDP-3-O-[3-hydroxymyristoyl] glucosamine N-acyltransferase
MEIHRTVDEVASLLRGEVEGAADRHLASLRSLEAAGPDDLAAVFRAEYDGAAQESGAGCLIVGRDSDLTPSDRRSLVRVDDPELAVDTLAASWGPREHGPAQGIHPSAVVEQGAEVDPSAAVGPWVFIGHGARIGPGVRLWPGVYVGADAQIGAGSRLYPGVFLGDRCILGERVAVLPNASIGAEGFGFRQNAEGHHIKSPQIGLVRIGDDCEIGACTTIDRARLEETVLGPGTKLDDQVHVGHNVVIGEHSALAGRVGLAGRARIGNRVLMGGAAGVGSGVTVGDGTVLGACAVALKDTGEGQYLLGIPAIPHRQWKRQLLSLERLPALIARMKSGQKPSDGAQRGAP